MCRAYSTVQYSTRTVQYSSVHGDIYVSESKNTDRKYFATIEFMKLHLLYVVLPFTIY